VASRRALLNALAEISDEGLEQRIAGRDRTVQEQLIQIAFVSSCTPRGPSISVRVRVSPIFYLDSRCRIGANAVACGGGRWLCDLRAVGGCSKARTVDG
jgi:hypothetical protein